MSKIDCPTSNGIKTSSVICLSGTKVLWLSKKNDGIEVVYVIGNNFMRILLWGENIISMIYKLRILILVKNIFMSFKN